jgi:VWFA-related protein
MAAALLLLSTPLPAQQPPPTQQTQPAQPPQRFTAAVHNVRVDVVVTDENGGFVADLGPDDFTLFEDGRRQEIVSVQLVDLSAGQIQRLGETGTAGVTVASSAEGEPVSDLGAIIFFIDLPGLYFNNTRNFAEAMGQMLDEVDRVTVPYAIYMVDQVGRLIELQPLTADLEALRRAAGVVRANPPAQSRTNALHRGALDNDGGALTRIAKFEERTRAIYTYELLRDFVDSLAHRSGRTALVWVSMGVDLAAYETIARPYALLGEPDPTPGARFRSYSPDLRMTGLQEALHRAANTANVSIYSVDPTTLQEFYIVEGSGLADRHGSAADARGNSLRTAAAATGGASFIGWSELDRVLENIERDAGRFYLLSYTPPADSGEGEYHEIRVEVDRADTRVRARQGYFRYSDVERRSRILQAALGLPGTVSGLDVSLEAIRARELDGQPLLIVDTAVAAGPVSGVAAGPASGATALPTIGAAFDLGSLLVYATVRDRDGRLVGSVERERLVPPRGAVPPDPAGSLAAGYWMHRAAHRLDPGRYDVRVAVIDPVTERVGAAGRLVEIEDTAGEWEVSDPWLMIQDAAGQPSPVVEGRVPVGERVVAYVEVYEGVTPSVSGRITPATAAGQGDAPGGIGAGDPAGTDTAGPLGPSIPLTEAAGIHRGRIPLSELPAGHYVLEFRIDDPGAGRWKTVRLPLEVLPSR